MVPAFVIAGGVAEMTEKTFSERYFKGLDMIEKSLAEAREVMRSADLVPLVLELKKEQDKLRARIVKLENKRGIR